MRIRFILLTTLLSLVSTLPLHAQICGANGCDDLRVEDLRAELSAWPGNSSDCNDDGRSNLLDVVCLLSIVPDFDPPVLEPIGDQQAEPGVHLSLALSASDPNGGTLVFSVSTLPENASFDTANAVFDFTPSSAQTGEHTVTFTVSDGFLSDSETIVISVLSSLEAHDQDLATDEDTAIELTLTASGDDPDLLQYSITDPPNNGTLTGTPPYLSYSPRFNYFGSDSFKFRASNGVSTSNEAVVSVAIAPSDDPPFARDLMLTTPIDEPVSFVLPVEEPDGDPLTFSLGTPTQGSVSGTPPNLTFTPGPGFRGTDSFTYAADDGMTLSNQGLITIATTLPNPTIDSHDSLTGFESITLSGDAPRGDEVAIDAPAGQFSAPVSNGRFSVEVPLTPNRKNTIFVTAVENGVRSAPRTTTVTHDAKPPSVHILFPAPGTRLDTEVTDVAGTVSDTLSGFLGLTVQVNGVDAVVDVGIGTNGSFVAANVPLVEGINTLTARATDVLGNSQTDTMTIVRQLPQAGQARIRALSGNAQEASVGGLLSQPAVVEVTDSKGQPLANKAVTFKVIRSDGLLSADGQTGESGTYQARTDSQGRASVRWRMGMDAGCGNNRLEARATGVTSSAFFCASGHPAPAAQINIGTGNNQRGEAGAPACEPLVVWVNDACNGVADIPVTFTVLEGMGKVNGQDMATVATSRTGHARVEFTLGPAVGANRISATFPGNPGAPAVFVLDGVVRDEQQPTCFAGVVIDNTGRAIGGARCRLVVGETETEPVASAADGSFRFENVPAGPGDLYVDGLVANALGGEPIPPGSFPKLHFEPILVPNVVNSLATPVKLPELNPANAVPFDNTETVELTVREIEGLRMIVQAGSMTRADGSVPSPVDPAVLSLNPVQAEDVPMPMPDGAAPPFAWTLQPGGAHFDPPIKIIYPNMSGLAPGALAFFLSFNHDTNNFEIVSTATVTADGASIVSDPGSGLTVAGWGCNCPPYSVTGTCQGEDPCKKIKINSVTAKAGGQDVWEEKVNKEVSFSANVNAQGCNTFTYEWDFGDGTKSTKASPKHKYAAVGKYTVKVKVDTNCSGKCDSGQDTVEVHVIDVKYAQSGNCSGYDDSTTPNHTLMVPVGSSNTAKALIDKNTSAAQVAFEVSNADATVSPTNASSSPETVTLTGVNHGTAELLAKGKTSMAELGKLNLDVKKRINKTIAIHAITEENDDLQAIPVGRGLANQVCITAGTNGMLESTAGGDDVATSTGIQTGPNGVCNSTANGDDAQVIAVGRGLANQVCVQRGNNTFRDTRPSGDDAVNGDSIDTGPNGVCETTANATNLVPTNVPSKTSLEAYLNDIWGKQANVYFTISRRDVAINYDFNRDGLMEIPTQANPSPNERDEIHNNAADASKDYNIYYVNGLTIAQGVTYPSLDAAWIHDAHVNSTNNVTAHEVGHLLGIHRESQNTNDVMYHTGIRSSPCRVRKNDWDDVNQ